MNWTLERLLPTFDKREHHSRRIDAPPERVWHELMDLRVGELAVTLGLMRVRGGPKTWVNGVDTGAHQGMDLRVLESMAPREMAADPPREVVLGDIARYTALRPVRPDLSLYIPLADQPGYTYLEEIKALVNHRDDLDWLCDWSPSVMIGDPDDFVARIRKLEAMGLDEVLRRIDGVGHENIKRSLELIGHEVIPVVDPVFAEPVR
ncbi:hypothetical protein [Streptomyces malaysiensis]|uniref:hypothetical protein n=1 Tax=Streptomyces malaysiensis TaxID=92644 RepID=UPI003720ABF3